MADHQAQVQPEPMQSYSCCAAHVSDATDIQGQQDHHHTGQQPSPQYPQDDGPPCKCPCSGKTLMCPPMISLTDAATPVYFNESHLVLLPVADRPAAVALVVAIQPPIA